MATLVGQYVTDPANLRLFLREKAAYQLSRTIEEAMERQGVTRKELARRLGVKRKSVAAVVDGNATHFADYVDCLTALGMELSFIARPIQISNSANPSRMPGHGAP